MEIYIEKVPQAEVLWGENLKEMKNIFHNLKEDIPGFDKYKTDIENTIGVLLSKKDHTVE